MPTLSVTLTREDIAKTVSAMSDRAKKLPKVKVSIQINQPLLSSGTVLYI